MGLAPRVRSGHHARVRTLIPLLLLGCASAPSRVTIERPRLAVVVVFDQFRADHLLRFADRLPANGGFNRLIRRGTWYRQAEHAVFQAMTCPGHSSVLTGAWPARTGLALNKWWDRETGQKVYCVEDAEHQLVGAKARPHAGTSPRRMRTGTVGDVLRNSGFDSHVVTVSLKDRAAIALGGHRAEHALWFERKSHRWISSDYYWPSKTAPTWVQALNERLASRKAQTYAWKSQGPGGGLAANAAFDHEWRRDLKAALASPLGDELTLEAVEAALEAVPMGQDAHPDLLGVSFSAFDKVGHEHGPESREIEEMTLAADAALGRLIDLVEARVGAEHVVFAVTGDHGVAPKPERMEGKAGAGRVKEKALRAALEAHLTEQLGPRDRPRVPYSRDFNFWFDLNAEERGPCLAAARAFLLTQPEILQVFGADALPQREPERSLFLNQFDAAIHGDLVALTRPYIIKAKDPANHLTSYSYDRLVPLILAGPGVAKGRRVHAQIVDLAPTLSYLLGVLPPPSSQGRVLEEALTR